MLLFSFCYLDGISQENKTLIIEGSQVKSTEIINRLGYQKKIKNDSLLTKELNSFRKKLLLSGYLEHQLDSIVENDSIYHVKLSLNKPIASIHISLPEIPFETHIRHKQSNSDSIVLSLDELHDYMNELLAVYQNNGYPFVSIKLSNIQKDNEVIKAKLLIDAGELRRIGTIVVKGYSKFPSSFIKHYLRIQQHTRFQKNRIAEISNAIQQLPFVSEVKKPEMLFTKDSSAIYMYLKKEKSNFFDGLIGLSNAQEEKTLQLNGYLNLEIQNALNFGESLRLDWLSDGKKSQSLKLALHAPYLFGTPISSSYDFDIYKQDTTYLNVNHHLSLNYQLLKSQRLGFAISTKKSHKITTQDTNDLLNFSDYFYGITYHYIKPSSHPIFNTNFELQTQVFQGKRNKTKQHKISNTIAVLLPISHNKNIWIKNASEILFSDTYFTNELYRVGGSNSIRGFDENSLLAQTYSYLNVDFNFLSKNTSYITVGSDFGFIKAPDLSNSIFTYSFGAGYTTKTKIGILGIHYFFGNTNKTPFSLKSSKLHIKLLQKF